MCECLTWLFHAVSCDLMKSPTTMLPETSLPKRRMFCNVLLILNDCQIQKFHETHLQNPSDFRRNLNESSSTESSINPMSFIKDIHE